MKYLNIFFSMLMIGVFSFAYGQGLQKPIDQSKVLIAPGKIIREVLPSGGVIIRQAPISDSQIIYESGVSAVISDTLNKYKLLAENQPQNDRRVVSTVMTVVSDRNGIITVEVSERWIKQGRRTLIDGAEDAYRIRKIVLPKNINISYTETQVTLLLEKRAKELEAEAAKLQKKADEVRKSVPQDMQKYQPKILLRTLPDDPILPTPPPLPADKDKSLLFPKPF